MIKILMLSTILLLIGSTLYADLIDRGGGLIYDTDLNITWLQDANYAKTSGYDADGRMTWYNAKTWADNLVYHGYDDWRLPSTLQPDPNCSIQGQASHGYNCIDSEMGHLYYIELGNTGGLIPYMGQFFNLQSYWYYSSTEYSPAPDFAWGFSFLDIPSSTSNESGWQATPIKNGNCYAIAVRDGDSFPIPEDIDDDGDGYTENQGDCDDYNPTVHPGASEIHYNCTDNDCNAETPYDDLDNDGYGVASDCNDSDSNIYPDASELKHDGLDQDCNGYDLSIDIIKATYKGNKDQLKVKAVSAIKDLANLYLLGYGSMEYEESKWSIKVNNVGGDPGIVTVCGIEGCDSINTTVK